MKLVTEEPEKKWYAPVAFAKKLDISKWTVYSMMCDGRLKSIKIGRLRRIPHSELERLTQEGEGVRFDF